MTALTTRQRDLLKLLLETSIPVGMADLAEEMKLSPRQIGYDLKSLEQWLAPKRVTLRVTPGIGVDVQCPPELRGSIAREISSATDLQLILPGRQRQQLLAMELLSARDPLILYQLQRLAQVSRTTILADLKAIEPWLEQRSVQIERRPNFGICVQGGESAIRQALLALLWGDPALGEPLTHLTHIDGLTFTMAQERHLLPLLSHAFELTRRWDTRQSAVLVAEAESQLGGRFSDDAVLYLALAFAVQAERVQAGHALVVDPGTLAWLQKLHVWPIATRIAAKLAWLWPARWSESETASVGMHLLAAPRNESWPNDPGIGSHYLDLLDEMMRHVAAAYGIPGLGQDQTLREAMINHIVPACMRQCFGLPMSPLVNNEPLSDDFATESAIAQRLVDMIRERIRVTLPETEVNNLALLLRAAYIRERQDYVRNVIVVCPSGMATAQLIVARMKAYFPRLGSYRVVSMRELGDETLRGAHIVITTVPLPAKINERTRVIQVHPLLLPQDVANITQWLAS